MAQSHRTTQFELPNDAIVEIFTRLPVKSLLKFKCVCRSWRAIISTQRFIKAHLENSKLAPTSPHYLLAFHRPGKFMQCSVNSMLYESVSQVSDLSYPFEPLEDYRMVGSCNGLVLVRLDKIEIILWNPSTRTCKKLPLFGVELAEDKLLGDYGLGYDKSRDDYKVLGFFYTLEVGSDVITAVYSLRNDEWKRIKNINYDVMSGCSAFANGKLYYFTEPECGTNWEILSIDLEKEEYEILRMPSNVKLDEYSSMAASEGSLFLLWPHPTFEALDVWMLDDGSVGTENWTKVITVPCCPHIRAMYRSTELLYVLKTGLVMFRDLGTFVVYDAKDGSLRRPRLSDMGGRLSVGVCSYVESLVSPVG